VLHFAVEKGKDDIVAQLLAHNPSLVEEKDYNGNTALHAAAERGHDGIVALLLAHSPSLIDTVDDHDCTPSHEAAKAGHIKVVAQLLARKPDLINKRDEDSYTALMQSKGGMMTSWPSCLPMSRLSSTPKILFCTLLQLLAIVRAWRDC